MSKLFRISMQAEQEKWFDLDLYYVFLPLRFYCWALLLTDTISIYLKAFKMVERNIELSGFYCMCSFL